MPRDHFSLTAVPQAQRLARHGKIHHQAAIPCRTRGVAPIGADLAVSWQKTNRRSLCPVSRGLQDVACFCNGKALADGLTLKHRDANTR